MPDLPQWAWYAAALVAVLGVVSFLRVLAIQVRNDTALHDLRHRVFEVRIGYLRQIIAAYQPSEPQEEVYSEDDVAEYAEAA